MHGRRILRLGVLAVVCKSFKIINEFQKMADKENAEKADQEKGEALKLDGGEKAIFDKIIKEGNGGKVKSYA